MQNPFRKIAALIRTLVVQGLTAEKIALTIACGVVLGLMPVIGTTTLLCTLVALALGLNLALIQLVNYLVYPLEIVLLVPFLALGHWIVTGRPLPLNTHRVLFWFHEGWLYALTRLWRYLLEGLLAWALIGGILGLLLYFILYGIVRRFKTEPVPAAESSEAP
ncbi:MAG: DUF2062 domain-containing protein [Gammaproteobacteria bacterium]